MVLKQQQNSIFEKTGFQNWRRWRTPKIGEDGVPKFVKMGFQNLKRKVRATLDLHSFT